MSLQYANSRKPLDPYHQKMTRYWYDVAKERAKELGITYEGIAEELGVAKSTVGHWLTGRNRPRLDTLKRIAKVLDMPVMTMISEDAYFLVEEDERALVDVFRLIPPDQRAHAAAMLEAYAQASSKDPQEG